MEVPKTFHTGGHWVSYVIAPNGQISAVLDASETVTFSGSGSTALFRPGPLLPPLLQLTTTYQLSTSGVPANGLTCLPSYVIRRIIGMELESLQSLKLISPRWSELSRAFLTDRKRLPSIKSVHWDRTVTGKLSLRLRIPNRYRHYFGVDNWSGKGRKILPILSDSNSNIKINIDVGDRFENMAKERWFSNITRLISRCSHIEKLKFHVNLDQRQFYNLDHITNAIDGVEIRKLHFTGLRNFTDRAANRILRVIRTSSAQDLVLVFDFLDMCSPSFDPLATMVSEAVGYVSTIEITKMDVFYHHWTEPNSRAHWCAQAIELSRAARVNATFSMDHVTEKRARVRLTVKAC